MEEVPLTPAPGGGAQEFRLQWKNFSTNLATSLDIFKNEKDFVDVTLVCEGQQLLAHRMLLCACSPYFRNLIKANPCPHPIIILSNEVKYTDLEKLLDFMYQGSVNVVQEHLARFLKTAEMLKIRGLADDDKKSMQPVQHPSSPCLSNSGTITPNDCGSSPKRPRLSLDNNNPCTSTSSTTLNNSSSTNNSYSNNTTGTPPTTLACSVNLDTPNTPSNIEESTHSANDSDSEMLPVKQEMVELKSCDEFETDADQFIPEAYLKEGVGLSTSEGGVQGAGQGPPPPPGALRPSYVPPPPIKAQEGLSRASGQQPVGGLIRRFLEECLQLPSPGPLLSAYTGLEGTPHFQLLRSVAKEWSYCKNATQNYTTMGGKSKRQRATSRLIETFENIDSLRSQLAQLKHEILVMEMTAPGLVKRVCKAEAVLAGKVREQQAQKDQNKESGNSEASTSCETPIPSLDQIDLKGVNKSQQEVFTMATEVMKQLRKLYFDQSRRLAVRISQLKKGRQVTQERMQRQQSQLQQSFVQNLQHQQQHSQQHQHQATIQQQQHQQQQQNQQQQQQHHQQQNQQHQQQNQQQHQQQQLQHMQQQLQLAAQENNVLLPHQLSLHHLHQPWSD